MTQTSCYPELREGGVFRLSSLAQALPFSPAVSISWRSSQEAEWEPKGWFAGDEANFHGRGTPVSVLGHLGLKSEVYSYCSFVSVSLWIRGPQTGAGGLSTFFHNWFSTGMQPCPGLTSGHVAFTAQWQRWGVITMMVDPESARHLLLGPSEKVCGSPGSASGGFFTHLPMQKPQGTGIQSLGREDLLEEGAATHSSSLAWRIPWTEEPGGLPAIASHRAGHEGSDLACSTVSLTILTWAGPARCARWLSADPGDPAGPSPAAVWAAPVMGDSTRLESRWALMFPSRALASQMSQGLGVPKIPYSGPS